MGIAYLTVPLMTKYVRFRNKKNYELCFYYIKKKLFLKSNTQYHDNYELYFVSLGHYNDLLLPEPVCNFNNKKVIMI